MAGPERSCECATLNIVKKRENGKHILAPVFLVCNIRAVLFRLGLGNV